MTKEEAIARLNRIIELDKDPESDHAKADEILLHLINDVDITEVYRKIRKWYS